MPTDIGSRPLVREPAVSEYDLAPPPLIPRIITQLAWPSYECECCVGQERWQGCYCDYHKCVGPCEPPEGPLVPPWRQGLRGWVASLARPVYALMARRTGHYPCRD